MSLRNREYNLAIIEIIKHGHWITDQVTKELREFDISEPQFNVMQILNSRSGEPVTMQEIQSGMVQKSSNVTRIVDKLLGKGFVKRSTCEHNRRKLDITLTDEGVEYLKVLIKRVDQLHAPMQKNLTPKESLELIKLIKKMKGKR